MYEEAGPDTFSLYANGTEIDSFVDIDFTGGYSGYACSVRRERRAPGKFQLTKRTKSALYS
jgi:hypothetical protein